MSKQTNTDFTLPQNAYAAFDATSLKSLIEERLSEHSTFTGQNFEGSNLSSMIDIIAYSYHVLLFYLNQTSSESSFNEAELYQNMNRIVKLIDYKPVGEQTCALAFKATAPATLAQGTYTVPKYSFVDVGGLMYSFTRDITFSKLKSGQEELTDFSSNYILHQGLFKEHPTFFGLGEDFETVIITPGDDVIIDHFAIHVYVRNVDTGVWEEWERTSSLYLETSTATKFDVRLNENKRYEIRFGDGVTGKKINEGDEIAVYYLQSDGALGEVGVGAIDNSTMSKLNTVQFTSIFNDIKDTNITYTTQDQLTLLTLTNENASSEYYTGETVQDIRDRAPRSFSSQYRLVTKGDYETYIKQAFSNVLRDVKVVNNWDYLDGHLRYNFDTLKLKSANKDPRTLYNQVTFADSCDFNNIYVYAVPRLEQTSSGVLRTNYLSPAQKGHIINKIRDTKMLTTETVIMDPVYVTVTPGLYDQGNEKLDGHIETYSDQSIFHIERAATSSVSLQSIENQAYNIIVNYFRDFSLGQTIDVTSLVSQILSIDGVVNAYTYRQDTKQRVEGLNFFIWNPLYPHNDYASTSTNVVMPYYKYPYLRDPTNFINKVKAVSEPTSTGTVEY